MPKMKSHSGAKKRFKVSPNGKVKHKKQGLRHLLTGTPGNKGRALRKTAVLKPTETNQIKKYLPYSF